MQNLDYFFAAYIIVWVMMFLYLFSISRREKKIRREMAELGRRVSRQEERDRGAKEG